MEKTGKRIRLTPEEVELVYEHRADNTNLNGNTALDIHLEERGINKKDVVSVKHWQSASGEWRFSVVTKQDLNLNQDDVLDKISDFIDKHSPYYPPRHRSATCRLFRSPRATFPTTDSSYSPVPRTYQSRDAQV